MTNCVVTDMVESLVSGAASFHQTTVGIGQPLNKQYTVAEVLTDWLTDEDTAMILGGTV